MVRIYLPFQLLSLGLLLIFYIYIQRKSEDALNTPYINQTLLENEKGFKFLTPYEAFSAYYRRYNVENGT